MNPDTKLRSQLVKEAPRFRPPAGDLGAVLRRGKRRRLQRHAVETLVGVAAALAVFVAVSALGSISNASVTPVATTLTDDGITVVTPEGVSTDNSYAIEGPDGGVTLLAWPTRHGFWQSLAARLGFGADVVVHHSGDGRSWTETAVSTSLFDNRWIADAGPASQGYQLILGSNQTDQPYAEYSFATTTDFVEYELTPLEVAMPEQDLPEPLEWRVMGMWLVDGSDGTAIGYTVFPDFAPDMEFSSSGFDRTTGWNATTTTGEHFDVSISEVFPDGADADPTMFTIVESGGLQQVAPLPVDTNQYISAATFDGTQWTAATSPAQSDGGPTTLWVGNGAAWEQVDRLDAVAAAVDGRVLITMATDAGWQILEWRTGAATPIGEPFGPGSTNGLLAPMLFQNGGRLIAVDDWTTWQFDVAVDTWVETELTVAEWTSWPDDTSTMTGPPMLNPVMAVGNALVASNVGNAGAEWRVFLLD